MDWTAFQNALLATSTPVLPSAALVKWAYPICWAALLAWLALSLGKKLPPRLRLALAALVIVWALVPGVWSPVYWLGLAFQVPSLTTVLLAVAASVALWRKSAPAPAPEAPLPLLLLAAGLGWVLLLDMLVLLPVALYRWGFSVAALALVAIVAALLWAGARADLRGAFFGKWWLWVLPLALLFFVITRLPTGNVFDALLDPWLWLAAQVALVRRLWRSWAKRRRAPAATRG